MPRPLLYRTDGSAYHVTNRANNKEWFYIPLAECWRILTLALAQTARKYGAEIHTLVLMSNHYHLILSTPKRNLDDVMRYFQSIATQRIQRRTGRINHVFGARYKWSVLEKAYSLAYAYKYVYRNPVRAGLCERVEQYPFSTLADVGAVPHVEGLTWDWHPIPRNYEDRLRWLNTPSTKEQEELIGRALRRRHFQFTTNSNLQRGVRELKEIYGIEQAPDPAPFGTKRRLTPFG